MKQNTTKPFDRLWPWMWWRKAATINKRWRSYSLPSQLLSVEDGVLLFVLTSKRHGLQCSDSTISLNARLFKVPTNGVGYSVTWPFDILFLKRKLINLVLFRFLINHWLFLVFVNDWKQQVCTSQLSSLAVSWFLRLASSDSLKIWWLE